MQDWGGTSSSANNIINLCTYIVSCKTGGEQLMKLRELYNISIYLWSSASHEWVEILRVFKLDLDTEAWTLLKTKLQDQDNKVTPYHIS